MSMKIIDVGKKKIGINQPVFIIAEAGANWRVSLDMDENYRQALRLIDIAASAGADAVKFQLYRAEKLYTTNAGSADYIGKKKSIYEIIQEMELPYEWLKRLKQYCNKKGIIFLCTPFDEKSVDKLESIQVPAYKVASYTISHHPLLKYIARKSKAIILSTGAAGHEDIRKAISVIKASGNSKVVLLQCTAKYPAPLATLNLRAVPVLRRKYGCLTGLSDHSREPYTGPLGAVALGAKVIEKHFTTNNSLPGPDHGFAILPDELKELVQRIRMMEEALGTGKKAIQKDEQELHNFCWRKIFAKKDIVRGEAITDENVIALRPGKKYRKNALPAEEWEKIMGKKAKRNIEKDEPLCYGDV